MLECFPFFAESKAATGTSADLKSDTQTDAQIDTNKDSNDEEKPKSPKKDTPKSSEESGDPAAKPLLGEGEKEKVAVRPEKTGLTDSGQGDSQA